nr:immunoglobulin heavy chain junction region [Mus musculus]
CARCPRYDGNYLDYW